jgi:hypothetical protein
MENVDKCRRVGISEPKSSAKITTEEELANYLVMPVGGLECVECDESRIEEAKSALTTIIKQAKTEKPGKQLKEVLFEYWGTVEAFNSYQREETMRNICKTFLIGVKQLGLYNKMDTPVRDF